LNNFDLSEQAIFKLLEEAKKNLVQAVIDLLLGCCMKTVPVLLLHQSSPFTTRPYTVRWERDDVLKSGEKWLS
jgi:hypothetical protein